MDKLLECEVLAMNRDIVPEFRRIISKLPLVALEEMKRHFEEKSDTTERAIQLAVFDLSIEILKVKWGCRR